MDVTYYGTATAEYNPEYWEGSIVGDVATKYSNWAAPSIITDSGKIMLRWEDGYAGPGSDDKTTIKIMLPSIIDSWSLTTNGCTVDLNQGNSENLSFTVTKNTSGRLGWIIDSGSVTVNFKVKINKVFGGWNGSDGNPYDPGDVVPSGTTLSVNWITPDIYYYDGFNVGGQNTLGNWRDAVDYSNSLRLYRTIDDGAGTWYQDGRISDGMYSTRYDVSGNVNVDSLSTGTYRSINDDGSKGNGKLAIILNDGGRNEGYYSSLSGDVILDNISLEGNESNPIGHGSEHALYAQGNKLIVGTGVTCSGYDEGKAVQINGGWYERDHSTPTGKEYVTDVRIFSGTYANIFGGSYSGNLDGTINVVLLGGTVTDTIYGGSMYGNVTETNVLVVGGEVYNEVDSEVKYEFKENYQTIVGGSRYSGTVSESNVTISNLGKIYAVQGGGRSGTGTYTNVTNVEVSGKAEVYYLVCGSVTDGNNTNTDPPVGTANVVICDSAVIGKADSKGALVFAGGWDTWQESKHPSTRTTTLMIEDGCTINGDVFGGGFRGAVGTESSNSGTAVDIEVLGGTIAGSLYGGGRGGPDPLGQVTDNGQAYVYGDVSILVQGATINGSVYGGGLGISGSDGDIAKVTGDVDLTIESSTIEGSVYGGGENGKVQGSTNVEVSGTVKGSVYGGGNQADVRGSATVTTHQGSEVKDVYGGGYSEVTVGATGSLSGSLYGGGEGASASVAGVSVIVLGDVAGSVYGGGDLGPVSGSIALNITGARVGAVYGGGSGAGGTGNDALVSGNIAMDLNSAHVVGSVYGGGHGVSNGGNVAAVQGNVTMTVTNSTVGGDLYGGGEYGLLKGDAPATLRVTLRDSTVEGSVYSGGMGEPGVMVTDLQDRFLTIDGGSVGGSVYGGSRYGDDNYSGSSPPTDRNSFIYILSGNIEGGSSGNVYGGGYMAYSAMDSHIFIGESATGSLPGETAGAVSIRSVYGGSSVGASDSGMLDAQLLLGDAEVRIGGEDVTISGDVFGAGDFCDISGTSEVRFEGFSQSGSMLSVQKADLLVLEDSVLRLKGNIDGSSTTGTPMYSLNLIGQLDMVSDSGRSELVLESAASQISGFSSTYTNIPGDASGYNVLEINNGMVFAILGENNTGGENMGHVQGMTLVRSDSNKYYGALVMADRSALVDNPTFWHYANGSYQEMEYDDYDYGTQGVRAWHLQGAYKVEQTVVFQDNTGEASGMSQDLMFTLPKVSNASTIVYAGHYITPSSPRSMYLVSDPQNPGTDLSVVFGQGSTGQGLTLFGQGTDGSYAGLNLINQSGNVASSPDSSGAGLNMTISMVGGYHSTGYIGSVIVHFAEVSGGLVFNVLDVEVKVYLRTSVIPQTGLAGDVVMRGDGTYEGTVDIYLPALPGNATGVYTVRSVDADGELSVLTVPTNLNRDGWIQTGYRSEPLTLNNEDGDVLLGTGGVFSPVLRVTYTTQNYTEPTEGGQGGFLPFTIVIEVESETGEVVTKEITLNVTPQMASTNTVTFYDKVLDLGVTGSWSQYVPMFSIGVLFGESVDQYYVVAKTDLWDRSDATAFIGSIEDSLLKNEDGNTLTSTDRTSLEDDAAENEGYQVILVTELLDKIIKGKPDTPYNDNNGADLHFDYSEEDCKWYDSPSGHGEFDFGSEIAQETVGVYSGYSILLHVFVKNTDIGGRVNQSVLFPGAPGSQLDLYGRITVTPGYEITEWWYGSTPEGSTRIKTGTSSDGQTTVPLTTYSTTNIYVVLAKIDYELEVVFDDGTGSSGGYTYTVTGGSEGDGFQVGDKVTITAGNLGGMHISGATGNDGAWNMFIVNLTEVSFTAPAMDLTVTIHLSSNFTVTVTLPQDEADNVMFGFQSVGSGTLVHGGRLSSSTFVSTLSTEGGAGTVTISAPAYEGHSVVLSLYDSEGALVGNEHSPSVSFGISDLEADASYKLRVNVLWKVTLGEGYSATVTDGATVYTGDVIRLTLEQGHAFGNGFYAVGAAMTGFGSGYREYTVNIWDGNRTDVVFGDAEYAMIIVTVDVVFKVKGETATEEPVGSVTMSSSSGSTVLTGGTWSSESGMMTYETVVLKQTYTFEAVFTGYGDGSKTEYIGEDMTVTIELDAEKQRVEFSSGSSVLKTYDWYIGDKTALSGMYSNPGYLAWTDGETLFRSDSVLAFDMFEDGVLTLIGLPVVVVIPSEWDVMEVLVDERSLESGVEVLVGEGFDGPVKTSVNDVTAKLDGVTLTLQCHGGTGSFHVVLEGPAENLVVIVTVAGSVEDIGGQNRL